MESNEIYEAGMLTPETHPESWLRKMPKYARDAGIPEQFIYTSMVGISPHEDIEWIRRWHLKENAGAYMLGTHGMNHYQRMQAMTGCFVRNKINARMLTAKQFVAADRFPMVALIPDFFVSDKLMMSSWQLHDLMGLLFQAEGQDCRVVLYVSNMAKMHQTLGTTIKEFITNQYVLL